ncbi:MAG: class I SAM-dependent methyltransferase [Oligoflexia bacterium]|nr:class I SAM-dependent methyltransferase [Oligoflexia bacterium]
MSEETCESFFLVASEEDLRLKLFWNEKIAKAEGWQNFKAIDIDLYQIWREWESESFRRAGDPLWRALGFKGRPGEIKAHDRPPIIFDATAGFGIDSLRLLFYGGEVYSFERSQLLLKLLASGRGELLAKLPPEVSQKLSWRLIAGDACNNPTALPRPEIIYLDPMYPPRVREKGAQSKEMRVLQRMVGKGSEEEDQRLFAWAKALSPKRIIVKRPFYANPFAKNPLASIKGKLLRFEVYSYSSLEPEKFSLK